MQSLSAAGVDESRALDLPKASDIDQKSGVVFDSDKEILFAAYSEELKTEDWTTPSVDESEEDDVEEEEEDEQSVKTMEKRMGMVQSEYARQLFSLRCGVMCASCVLLRT